MFTIFFPFHLFFVSFIPFLLGARLRNLHGLNELALWVFLVMEDKVGASPVSWKKASTERLRVALSLSVLVNISVYDLQPLWSPLSAEPVDSAWQALIASLCCSCAERSTGKLLNPSSFMRNPWKIICILIPFCEPKSSSSDSTLCKCVFFVVLLSQLLKRLICFHHCQHKSADVQCRNMRWIHLFKPKRPSFTPVMPFFP